MQVAFNTDEIEMIIEALDCLKIKISCTKGASYAEKTSKLMKTEAIELKLRSVAPEATGGR
jgi:hypothetical protein